MISEEAVDAALDAYEADDERPQRVAMRRAIEAALAHVEVAP